MAEPSFWQTRHHPLSLALTPLAWLYGGMEAARRRLTHAQHPGKPVICVGNLTAGGAGKTPTVRWLAEKMAAQGHQPAILSRGYGGSEKGPLKVDRAPIMAAKSAMTAYAGRRLAGLYRCRPHAKPAPRRARRG